MRQGDKDIARESGLLEVVSTRVRQGEIV